jgi:outer membrane protein TolC
MNSRYSSGLATVADLAQAQYLLNRAEADVVLTRIAAWRAWLDQCTARGNLAPFLARIR